MRPEQTDRAWWALLDKIISRQFERQTFEKSPIYHHFVIDLGVGVPPASGPPKWPVITLELYASPALRVIFERPKVYRLRMLIARIKAYWSPDLGKIWNYEVACHFLDQKLISEAKGYAEARGTPDAPHPLHRNYSRAVCSLGALSCSTSHLYLII